MAAMLLYYMNVGFGSIVFLSKQYSIEKYLGITKYLHHIVKHE